MGAKHLHIIVDNETEQTLNSTRHSRGWSYTKQVEKAVKVLDYILAAQEAGGTVVVQDKDGNELTKVHFV